jgi:predicted anti-sigma-YlaC factor YlaD
MLKCQEVTGRASDYIDGDLNILSRFRIRLHLLTCRHCRRFMRQMQATIDLLGSSMEDKSPVPINDDLLAAYRASSKRRPEDQS